LGLFSYYKMTILIIILLIVADGFALSRNQSVKNIFKPEQKYYTIDDEYNAKRKERQEEIDKLLSKIGKNGLDDLTEKERKRLDELSRK
jgi:DNA-binding PadR family transcriptional regulator